MLDLHICNHLVISMKTVTSEFGSKLVLLVPLHITSSFVLTNIIISLLEVKMGKEGRNNKRMREAIKINPD